jgi:hypothetical protein
MGPTSEVKWGMEKEKYVGGTGLTRPVGKGEGEREGEGDSRTNERLLDEDKGMLHSISGSKKTERRGKRCPFLFLTKEMCYTLQQVKNSSFYLSFLFFFLSKFLLKNNHFSKNHNFSFKASKYALKTVILPSKS